MDVKISADLNKAIDQLADKLGIAASELLPHFTKLQYISGVLDIIIGVITVAAPFLLYVLYPEGFDINTTFIWGRLIFVIIMLFIGGSVICNGIINVLAPQAAAVEKLIDIFTPSQSE